jgi:DNA-binding NarL/FixJ family response regulator
MKARLIIADDHEVVRQGLREMIESTPDLEVVAEAADGAEAERLARSCGAELMILDISLPKRRGVHVLESLRADGVRLPVLLFTMHPASQYREFVRAAGAQGFVSKAESSTRLLQAIRDILAGREAFPERRLNREPRLVAGDPFGMLSRREAEVLRGLLLGRNLTRIAADLEVGVKAVSTYRRRMLDKLGVDSNAELAALAARHGKI